MTGDRSESIFRPALLLMAGRMLGFAAAFAIPVVLVRVFDQSEFGTYKQLFLMYTTLFGIAQFGMAESLFYFLPSGGRQAGRYTCNAMLLLVGAGALCFAGLWAAGNRIAGWFNNDSLATYLPLVGLYLVFMLGSAVFEIVMIARKRHFLASCVYACSDVLRTLMCILPALIYRRLEWLMVGMVVAAVLRYITALTYLRKEFGGGFRPDKTLLLRQLGYAAPFAAAVFIDMLQSNLHMYAVSFHFDAATFAIYSVGCMQIPLVDFMMTSSSNVLMVRMREHLQADDRSSVLTTWHDATRKLAMIFVPMVGCLLVVAHELIVTLFTASYTRSVPVFMVWTMTVLLSALLTDSILRVYAQMRFLIVMNVLKLLLLVLSINWFLSSYGLMGAVLVTLLVTLVAKVMALARSQVLMGCTVRQLLPWRHLAGIVAVGTVAAIPALALKALLPAAALTVLVVTSSVYLVGYFALLLLCGPLHREEKEMLSGWMHRPLGMPRDYSI